MLELNKIYNMDCISGMKLIEDNSIDLVVTSPPYDGLREYNGYSFDFENTAKELYRIVKDGGVVVWVVGDATINGSETGTSFRQALYFMSCGFNLHDTMIWQKTNPMPKVKTERYFDVFEYMFIFSKGVPKTFNPIMVDCKMGGKIYDSTCKNMGGESGRTKKTFVLNKQRYKNNIWEIAIAQNKTKHPAVFPEQLAQDHIISWSNENDTVLDCFMGSGTTGKMALLNGRKYIGFEISKEYCDIANERLKNIEPKQINLFEE
jgi:site-specific DNA-methyltransferase (adenine-specific)